MTATTYTFTVRSGVTLTDAKVTVRGSVVDVDAALASGGGEIVTTDQDYANALKELRVSDGLALDVDGVPGGEVTSPSPRYAVYAAPDDFADAQPIVWDTTLQEWVPGSGLTSPDGLYGMALTNDGEIEVYAIHKTPVNSVAPAISGEPAVGVELTCSTGTWAQPATLTFAYQWKANGVNVSGATSSTWTPESEHADADVICRVTATNDAGTVSADSNEVTIEGWAGPSALGAALISWRKASDIAGSDGAAVTSWADKVGGRPAATQGTGAKQPVKRTAGILGEAAVEFDGTNDFLQSTAITEVTGLVSHYLVVQFVSILGSIQTIVDGISKRQFIMLNGSGQWNIFGGSGFGGPASGPTAGTPYLLRVDFDTTDRIEVDGVEIFTGMQGDDGFDGVTYGISNNGVNFPANVRIAEHIVVNEDVTTEEHDLIVGYLQSEYAGL